MGSTALIAAGLLAAPAMAQSAAPGKQPQPLRLGLGGYFQAYGVYVSQPDSPGEYGVDRKEFDIKREAEVWFTGSVKLDNGLTVGAQIELEAEVCSDQIDESYLYFEGGWGKLILGSENSAGYLLSVGPPSVDGNFDGIDPNYRVINGLGSGSLNRASEAWLVNISGDSEKFTYISPRFAGFQVGVSYTPDNSEEATAGQVRAKGGAFAGMPTTRQSTTSAAAWEDVIAAGINYTNRFGPVSVAASVSYERGSLSGCPSGTVCTGYDDRETWAAYAKAGFAGFEFGGGYFEDDNGLKGDNKSKAWGLGLTYGMGPWVIGASYLDYKRELPGLKDDRLQRVLVGGRYTYGPGMDLRASVQWYGLDSSKPTAEGDSWAVVLGTVVNF
ncbi:MAG: porin [Alphaproteobacteria bacterium]